MDKNLIFFQNWVQLLILFLESIYKIKYFVYLFQNYVCNNNKIKYCVYLFQNCVCKDNFQRNVQILDTGMTIFVVARMSYCCIWLLGITPFIFFTKIIHCFIME